LVASVYSDGITRYWLAGKVNGPIRQPWEGQNVHPERDRCFI